MSISPPLTAANFAGAAVDRRRLIPSSRRFRCASSPSSTWSPETWKSHPALQIPTSADASGLNAVLGDLASYPPLVFAGEARKLEARLGEAAMGQAFLLQGGDCAESFKEFDANKKKNLKDVKNVET